jgi:hypothetical protein
MRSMTTPSPATALAVRQLDDERRPDAGRELLGGEHGVEVGVDGADVDGIHDQHIVLTGLAEQLPERVAEHSGLHGDEYAIAIRHRGSESHGTRPANPQK